MSEIGSCPVRKVIIIVIKIIIILALFKRIHWVALHLLQMLFYKAILFFSPFSVVWPTQIFGFFFSKNRNKLVKPFFTYYKSILLIWTMIIVLFIISRLISFSGLSFLLFTMTSTITFSAFNIEFVLIWWPCLVISFSMAMVLWFQASVSQTYWDFFFFFHLTNRPKMREGIQC